GVRFDLAEGSADAGGTEAGTAGAMGDQPPAAALTALERTLVRVLQQDLPAVAEPFAIWARQAGVSPMELLAAAKSFEERGLIRRFSAVLRHRQLGIQANAMGAWAVPPERCDAFGARAAEFPAVTHCYLRPSYADWPYNLFTMVHAATPGKCEQILAEISAATG